MVWQFVVSDKCLDAGGSWKYRERRCDMGPGTSGGRLPR